jgi:hypothetical protein
VKVTDLVPIHARKGAAKLKQIAFVRRSGRRTVKVAPEHSNLDEKREAMRRSFIILKNESGQSHFRLKIEFFCRERGAERSSPTGGTWQREEWEINIPTDACVYRAH